MARILSSLPYSSQPLIVRGQEWRRPSPHQIFIWVSITQTGIDRKDFPSNADAFPALLDTGCSLEFLISSARQTPALMRLATSNTGLCPLFDKLYNEPSLARPNSISVKNP